MADFSNTAPTPTDLGIVKRWEDCKVAITDGAVNPTTVKNGDVVQGVLLSTGERFLMAGAMPAAGPYTVGSSNSSRASDANNQWEFTFGKMVRVLAGADYNVGLWIYLGQANPTLGSTTLTFSFNKPLDTILNSPADFSNTAPTATALP